MLLKQNKIRKSLKIHLYESFQINVSNKIHVYCEGQYSCIGLSRKSNLIKLFILVLF